MFCSVIVAERAAEAWIFLSRALSALDNSLEADFVVEKCLVLLLLEGFGAGTSLVIRIAVYRSLVSSTPQTGN